MKLEKGIVSLDVGEKIDAEESSCFTEDKQMIIPRNVKVYSIDNLENKTQLLGIKSIQLYNSDYGQYYLLEKHYYCEDCPKNPEIIQGVCNYDKIENVDLIQIEYHPDGK